MPPSEGADRPPAIGRQLAATAYRAVALASSATRPQRYRGGRATMTQAESPKKQVVRPPAEFKPPKWEAKENLPASAALEPAGGSSSGGETLRIGGKGSYVIGRVDTADIVLIHSSISRHHCAVVHHTDGRVYVIECARPATLASGAVCALCSPVLTASARPACAHACSLKSACGTKIDGRRINGHSPTELRPNGTLSFVSTCCCTATHPATASRAPSPPASAQSSWLRRALAHLLF